MAKKNVDKERHYKNIINKQKRIIQDLKKKVGRADKIEERYTNLEELEAEILLEIDAQEVASKYNCPKCKGQLDVIDGSRVKVFICKHCDYRASKKCQ
jgi:ribosomal protein L37AE/L43A